MFWLLVFLWVVLPLLLGLQVIVRPPLDRITVMLRALLVLAMLPVYFWVPQWAFMWYPLRYLIAGVLGAALMGQVLWWRRVPWFRPASQWQWLLRGLMLGSALLFGFLAIDVLAGLRPPAECMPVQAPLRHGTYLVMQGGNTLVLNNHQMVPEQRFALDMLKLKWGLRGKRIGFLRRNEESYIWGDTIYAVCDGPVLAYRDSMHDVPPSPTHLDTLHPEGNYVLQACAWNRQQVRVLYAHIQYQQVWVRVGDTLRAGQPIGLVGNTGNTSEPHLHIHAIDTAQNAIALCIHGQWLIRQDLFKAQP